MMPISANHPPLRVRLAGVGRIARRLLSGLLLIAAVLLLLDRLLPPDLERAGRHSAVVLDARGALLRGFTTTDEAWRLPVRLDDVDPLYLRMLQAYEDQRFAWHPGVDPLALVRALAQWASEGRVISGASTLTMQTARLLEPRPRTLVGKLAEMARALQLEWRYDKATILTGYLDLAPYGGNLEGLRAASLAYLGKEPSRLTPAEAALLVVLPQSPSRLRPDRFPLEARAARDKVLARMGQLGVLTARQVAEAVQEEPVSRRDPLPFHAPHLAERLRAAAPAQAVHRTFIDGSLQHTLEALARQQPPDAAGSTAILVVANRDRTVLAYVGAADYFAAPRAGQVDMVRAVRSPGSTLKPFVYGMGFDELIIHPETLIDDVPTRFGDYSPSNFFHVYHGQLSIREALQSSLNIPAVAVLDQLGPARFAARLRAVGVPLRWRGEPAQPGLPLVLGGAGTTLEGLVTLYAGIANKGLVAPLRFSQDDAASDGQALVSETASWYLARILQDAAPPDAVVAPDNTRRGRLLAHKTGTSYGFRDAWALGFDSIYTVGVWTGRADGSPSPGLYGRNSAAPLLFRVFELLPAGEPPASPVPPAGALLADARTLPARLRHFRAGAENGPSMVETLKISFPVNGSKIELKARAGGLDELPLIAIGGRRPLRWLVNGVPVVSSALKRSAVWLPDGAGFARVTVMDEAGQAASAEVWIDQGGQDG